MQLFTSVFDLMRTMVVGIFLAATALSVATAQPTVYWSNTYSGTLQRSLLGSGEVEDLIEGFIDRPGDLALDLAHGKMYWSLSVQSPSPNSAIIQRSNLDGSNLEDLILSGNCNPYCPISAAGLSPDGRRLYWFTWDGSFPASHGLFEADLESLTVQSLRRSTNVVFDSAIDETTNRWYWLDAKLPDNLADHSVWRSDGDGSNPEEVVRVFDGGPPGDGNIALDVSRGKLYWVTDNRGIRRANLDGTEIEDIVLRVGESDSTKFGDIAIDADGGKLYWSATYGGQNSFPVGVIHRSNLDGTEVEEVVSIADAAIGSIAIDTQVFVNRESATVVSREVSLGVPFPNPAMNDVAIPIGLDRPELVELVLYDVLGREVAIWYSGVMQAGGHTVAASTAQVPSGVYIIKMGTEYRSTARILVIQR